MRRSYRQIITNVTGALVQKMAGTMKKDRVVAMAKNVVFPCFCLCILLLSLRGLPGNPKPVTLVTKQWEDNGPFELSPERGRFALTYSLIENKSFYFPIPLARFVLPDVGFKNGHYVSLFAPGVSFLIAPGYVIGRYFGLSQVGAFAVIALFAVFNAILIKKIASLFAVGNSAATIAAMTFLFATPAFNYGITLYQHHISTFLILSGIYLLFKKTGTFGYWLFWFLFAASVPVDYPNLFLMLPLALFAALKMVPVTFGTNLTVRIRIPIVLSALGMLLPLLFFFWFNFKSYGNPMQFSGTVASVQNIDAYGNPGKIQVSSTTHETSITKLSDRKKSAAAFFQSRNLINSLYIHIFSPDRGILTFTPVIVLSLVGIVYLLRKRRDATIVLVGIMVADITLYSLWGDPWGGWAFGSRYLIPLFAVGSICIGELLDRWGRNIAFLLIFAALFGYSAYVNTAGALTSSANPPRAEVLYLEKVSGIQQRYSFDRNIHELKQGVSKSFAYQAWFSKSVSAYTYFLVIVGSIVGFFGMQMILLAVHSRKTHD